LASWAVVVVGECQHDCHGGVVKREDIDSEEVVEQWRKQPRERKVDEN
jgi:hypothetical protein